MLKWQKFLRKKLSDNEINNLTIDYKFYKTLKLFVT